MKKSKQSQKKPFSPIAFIISALVIFITLTASYSIYSNYCHQNHAITRLHELSNHNSGSTLKEVITTIQSERPQYEIIFVFDQNGHKLIEYTDYSILNVGLPDEAIELLRQFTNLQHVHNHPLTDSGHSDNDLAMPAWNDLDHAIATLTIISPNHVYRMKRGANPWPSPDAVYEYFITLVSLYNPDINPPLMETLVLDGELYGYYTNDCLQYFANYFECTFEVIDTSHAT